MESCFAKNMNHAISVLEIFVEIMKSKLGKHYSWEAPAVAYGRWPGVLQEGMERIRERSLLGRE